VRSRLLAHLPQPGLSNPPPTLVCAQVNAEFLPKRHKPVSKVVFGGADGAAEAGREAEDDSDPAAREWYEAHLHIEETAKTLTDLTHLYERARLAGLDCQAAGEMRAYQQLLLGGHHGSFKPPPAYSNTLLMGAPAEVTVSCSSCAAGMLHRQGVNAWAPHACCAGQGCMASSLGLGPSAIAHHRLPCRSCCCPQASPHVVWARQLVLARNSTNWVAFWRLLASAPYLLAAAAQVHVPSMQSSMLRVWLRSGASQRLPGGAAIKTLTVSDYARTCCFPDQAAAARFAAAHAGVKLSKQEQPDGRVVHVLYMQASSLATKPDKLPRMAVPRITAKRQQLPDSSFSAVFTSPSPAPSSDGSVPGTPHEASPPPGSPELLPDYASPFSPGPSPGPSPAGFSPALGFVGTSGQRGEPALGSAAAGTGLIQPPRLIAPAIPPPAAAAAAAAEQELRRQQRLAAAEQQRRQQEEELVQQRQMQEEQARRQAAEQQKQQAHLAEQARCERAKAMQQELRRREAAERAEQLRLAQERALKERLAAEAAAAAAAAAAAERARQAAQEAARREQVSALPAATVNGSLQPWRHGLPHARGDCAW